MSLNDRTDATFMSMGVDITDVQGMMQQIVDCLGALRVRIKDIPIAP